MLFEEQISRKPDLYPWTQQFIDSMHNGHWTVNRFTFTSDIQDFKTKLNEQEREIIIRALSAIGQVETQVKRFWGRLGDNLPHPSIIDLGYVMANVEVIHNIAYERLLVALGLQDIFQKNLEIDIIKNRVKYLGKHAHRFYKDSKQQFIYSLILFTLFVENVSLFSQFYTINFFGRYKNVLTDTNQQVHYTRQEENIHALVGIKIINEFRREYPELFDDDLEEKVRYEAQQAYKYECEIIEWMINGYGETKLNALVLNEFIKNRINESFIQIGYNKVFEVDDKMLLETSWFEEELMGNTSSDFFFATPVEYSKNRQSFSAEELF